jgi:TetR/AcrR family transcriptional regulator, repressor of fatR-cypB operon
VPPARPARAWLLSEDDPPSKQAILDAALRLFVRQGLAATSIRRIGEEAGYTNPALFKFFEGKDALALHLFERCYARLHVRVAAAAAGGTFDEALDRVLDAFLALVEEDLEAFLYVQDTLRELWPRLPAAARKRSILRVLGELVERGKREGAVFGYRTPDIPVAAAVGLLAQFARMAYFGELALPVHEHRRELRLALRRVFGR